mmetsp:Transcript_7498/g.16931  ORF Transcript_7498/g.16931 Transcript_7498/m.16931 type:complete len:92 (-) Transcript_7498:193-468(-)
MPCHAMPCHAIPSEPVVRPLVSNVLRLDAKQQNNKHLLCQDHAMSLPRTHARMRIFPSIPPRPRISSSVSTIVRTPSHWFISNKSTRRRYH